MSLIGPEPLEPLPAAQVLALAQKHCPSAGSRASMSSSARLALKDAEALFAKGDMSYARKRALTSLKYSVGMFHPDYRRAIGVP